MQDADRRVLGGGFDQSILRQRPEMIGPMLLDRLRAVVVDLLHRPLDLPRLGPQSVRHSHPLVWLR
jgi:hypothetical protein